MSTFLNRLKVYAIGFGIGLIFVFFFFQNRGCSWLPDNRVKNSILDRVIVIQSDEAVKLAAKGITETLIIEMLNDGEVDFKKSKKDGESKIYMLEKNHVKLFFTLPEESFISEVRMGNQPVGKIRNSTTGFGKMIHFPKDENLIFVDTMALVSCRQEALGMVETKLILKSLVKSGTIDFAKTDFNVKPKPVQYFYFNDLKGRKIGAQAVWYKNKISVDQLDLPFETDCQ